MFVKIRNYYMISLYTDNRGGFHADIESPDNRYFTLSFSSITLKFYKNGSNAKLPKYLCKEALEMAIRKGITVLKDEEKENIQFGGITNGI